MTKDDIKKNELSISQQQAIHLLLTGLNDKQVAAELGVARQTVTNWRNHDSIFMAGLNSERKAAWLANQERMRSLMARVAIFLEGLVDFPSAVEHSSDFTMVTPDFMLIDVLAVGC